MKLLLRDFKHNLVKLQPLNLDDLWYLSEIIEPNDLVSSKSIRKIKIGDERKQSVVKKAVYIEIEVEKIDFSESSNSLRVSGKITKAPDDIPKGSYHTINIEEHSIIKLKKSVWLSYHKSRLEESLKNNQPSILICALDRKEVTFALLKSSGFDILTEFEGEVPEKFIKEKQKESFFYNEITKKLLSYVERYNIEHLILASPAFFKEDLLKNILKEKPELKSKIVLSTCHNLGKEGINEVIKRPELKEVLKQERISKESALIEELFINISKQNLVAYGFNEVKKAVEYGSVKKLLLTDSIIKRYRQEQKFQELESIIKNAESTKAEIFIISSKNDPGKKLDGIGGIACILRFNIVTT